LELLRSSVSKFGRFCNNIQSIKHVCKYITLNSIIRCDHEWEIN
jgi:hypothetical protein